MSKTKHMHAVIATITVALEYDPNDLAQLTTLNAQVRESARKIVGYQDIEIRLGKIPAPKDGPVSPPVTTVDLPSHESSKGPDKDDSLDIPKGLRAAERIVK